MKYRKTILTSGYFDPLHIGHIEYLKRAKALGNELIVIVNNDLQARIKKGRPFMSEQDRLAIISELSCVNKVYLSIDVDSTVCKTIEMVHGKHQIDIFAKGGDRFSTEIPEAHLCKRLKIEMVDGLGEKIRSSSKIIRGADIHDPL